MTTNENGNLVCTLQNVKMVENCCTCDYTCVKRSVVAFNIIFWFSGPALLGLSIWFILTLEVFSPAVDVTLYKAPCFLVIGVGATSVLFGVCGCLGSINENKKLLILFLLSLVVIFTCEIYACVKTFKLYDEVSSRIPGHFNFSIKYLYKYKDDTTTAINRIQRDIFSLFRFFYPIVLTPFRDRIQYHLSDLAMLAKTFMILVGSPAVRQLSCCGSTGFLDWQYSSHYRNKTLSGREIVPLSCCYDTTNPQCNVATIIHRDPSILFPQGCLEPLENWVKTKLLIFGWGTFGFCTFQLLGIALSCCLCKAMSDVYG